MRFLVVLLLFGVSVVVAQDVPDFTPSPEMTTFMDNIETVTSDIRDLEALKPIKRLFPTREDLAEYLRGQIGEDDAQIYAEAAQFYIAFDLLPEGSDLLEIYLNFLEAQVAGFYDTDTEEMNVLLITPYRRPDRLPLLEQIIYSHEYVHALQDQHFDLDALMGTTEQQIAEPDRFSAIQALVEGDASFVMNEYTVRTTQDNPGAAMAELLAAGLATGSLTVPPGTPPIIEREMLFPYIDGAAFVGALREEGGWELVNAAYANPPASTEHILHPERYLDGEMPVEVDLGPEVVLGDGWELLYDRPMGEFYLREYLDTQLDSLLSRRAARGWGGDTYRLYYDAENDSRAWVMRTAWDSTEDGLEFYNAFQTFGDKRFEGEVQTDGCWSDADDALCLSGIENGEVVISYGPTVEIAFRLLETQLLPAAEQ